MFQPAVQTIFGKTLVCRDMDKASQYSKSANMDCVTLEGTILTYNICVCDVCICPGDQVSRKGTLCGGYHPTSRLELHQQIKQLRSQLEQLEAERARYKQQLDDILLKEFVWTVSDLK